MLKHKLNWIRIIDLYERLHPPSYLYQPTRNSFLSQKHQMQHLEFIDM